MAVKAAVFSRLGDERRAAFAPHRPINAVRSFWLQGRCTRRPCRFLHRLSSSSADPTPPITISKLSVATMVAKLCSAMPSSPPATVSKSQPSLKRSSSASSTAPIENAASASEKTHPEDSLPVLTTATIKKAPSEITQLSQTVGTFQEGSSSPVSTEKAEASDKIYPTLCKYWLSGNCVHGEKCRNLQSLFSGMGFSLMAQLQGHKMDVTGIALPSGSDKLCSGNKDGTVRVWDCHTGKCVDVLDLGGEVGCLVNEGKWIFIGILNAFKAWNTQKERRTEP